MVNYFLLTSSILLALSNIQTIKKQVIILENIGNVKCVNFLSEQDNEKHGIVINCENIKHDIKTIYLYFMYFIFISIIYNYYFSKKIIISNNKMIQTNLLRQIIYISIIQVCMPIIVYTLEKMIEKHSIDIMHSEFSKPSNLDKIIYQTDMDSWNVFSYINWLTFSFVFSFNVHLIFTIILKRKPVSQADIRKYENEKLFAEILIFFPYLMGIAFGIFQKILIFNKEVMVNYAFNIVINLSIIIYVLKQKKSKNLYRLINSFYIIFYYFISFYTLFETSDIQILVSIDNLKINFIEKSIIRFNYVATFIGYFIQVFFTSRVLKKIIHIEMQKKQKYLNTLIHGYLLEWVRILFFSWQNTFLRKHLTKIIDQDETTLYFMLDEKKTFNIINNIILFNIIIFLMTALSITNKRMSDNKYVKMINKIYYFISLFSFYFLLNNQQVNIFQLILYQIFLTIYTIFEPLNIFKIEYHLAFGSKKFECFICCDECEMFVLFLPCSHWICTNCFIKENFIYCPYCRSEYEYLKMYKNQYCPIHNYDYIMAMTLITHDMQKYKFCCAKCYVGPGIFYKLYNFLYKI